MKKFLILFGIVAVSAIIIFYTRGSSFGDPVTEGRKSVATYEGEGNMVVGPFRPEEMMGIFSIQHKTSKDDSLLKVSLYQDSNKSEAFEESEDLLSAEIFSIGFRAAKDFRGERARKLGAVNFFLKIESQGEWKIDVLQPDVTEQKTFEKVTGMSHRVTPFYYFEPSTQKFSLTHDGLSTFQVQALDILGNRVNFLADEFGAYEGEVEITYPKAGFYTFGIIADGQWTINSLGAVISEEVIDKNE